jgi:adenosylcobinamide-GDP ribazoletransferase
MMSLLRPFLLAASFLTRLPVPFITPRDRELGRSAAFYPLIGLLLGLLLLGAGLLLSGRTSPELTAAILVTLLAMLTGGLHLDGVADCSDALGVFGDRERRLAVMKDPRSGALGVVALVLALALKLLALSEAGIWMLPAALVLSRWVAVVLAVALPYARERGTGGALSSQAGWREVLLGAILVAAGLFASGPVAWLGAAGGIVAALWLARTMHRALGGLTGDVYGAAIEVTEIGFFIAVAIVA